MRINKRRPTFAIFLTSLLFLSGIVMIGVGSYESLNPYSITLLDGLDTDPNPNPIIPPNNVDDTDPPDIDPEEDVIPTYPNGVIYLQDYFLDGVQYYLMIWVSLGSTEDDFEGYLIINNSTDAVYFDGQWWHVEYLEDIIDGTFPNGIDVSGYIDGYIDDEANAHDDANDSDDGGYAPESRNTLSWFFFGGSLILASFLPILIRKNQINK